MSGNKIVQDSKVVKAFNELLDVEPVGDNYFLGHRMAGAKGRVFGGQVLGQALMAAAKTVESTKLVHSSHNYFIRPGDNALPIYYQVFVDLDGRSFSNRRVVALQNDKPILSLTASFQGKEEGLQHQQDPLDFPGPEGLLNDEQLAQKYKDELPAHVFAMVSEKRPIEVRSINEEAHFLTAKPSRQQAIWFRAREDLGDNQLLHRSAFAYATDSVLLSTCTRPHELTWASGNLRSASIDHALWMHDFNINANQWMLYTMDTPWADNARGLNRGSIYTQDGHLLATVVQEGLIRVN